MQRAPPQLGAPWGRAMQRLPARAAYPGNQASAGRAASCKAPRSTAPSLRRLQGCNVTAPMVRLSESYTEYRRMADMDGPSEDLLQRTGSFIGGPAGRSSTTSAHSDDAFLWKGSRSHAKGFLLGNQGECPNQGWFPRYSLSDQLPRNTCLAAQRSTLESVRKDAAGPDAHAEAHDSYMSAVAHTGPQKRTPLQGLFDDHDSNGPPVDHQSTWAAGRLAQPCMIEWWIILPHLTCALDV